MKILSGILIILIFLLSFQIGSAQQLQKAPVTSYNMVLPSSQPDKSERIAKLTTSLEELYRLYKQGGNYLEYAHLHGLSIAKGSVIVTVLPESGYEAKDINENQLARLSVKVIAKASHSMRLSIPIAQLGNVAKNISGIGKIRNLVKPVADDVFGEGVTLMNADSWQNEGYDGTGAKVAIIDGGFEKLTDAQTNGDIPPTYYSHDYTGSGMESGGEHGTAVTEAVYDIAPGADYYLYKISDLTDFENAKDDAINHGVQVVNHSMSWFTLSYYDGTGGACDVANDAIAHGISWANSAGNEAESHYRAIFTPTADDYHDFTGSGGKLDPLGPEPGYVYLLPKFYYFQIWMNWNKYPATDQDYDLYLYKWNYSTEEWEEISSSTDRQTGSEEPVETIAYVNMEDDGRYAIAVKKYSATENVDFTIFSQIGLSYHTLESSVTDPGSATDVVTVGAIARDSYESGPQEPFSSQGPTTDGRPKPDVAAPDSCNSYAYGYWQGTSQSSPYAAGALVLIQSRFPGYTNEDVKNYLYTECTQDLGDPGRDNIYGWGKVLLPDPQQITVTAPNGGENWTVGTTEDITWTSTGTSGDVQIEYSVDGGTNWSDIISSTADDGLYSWSIPDNTSENCLVKITDTDGSPSDQSDAVFTISAAGILGDVNSDDLANSTDALIILSCDVGLDVSQYCPMDCGDVNSDGLVNSTDALIILSYDVGMEVSYPVGQPGCPTGVTPCAGCNP